MSAGYFYPAARKRYGVVFSVFCFYERKNCNLFPKTPVYVMESAWNHPLKQNKKTENHGRSNIITATLAGIFIMIPTLLFFIIKKIISDRHDERMAMIEKGMTGGKPCYTNNGTKEKE